MHFQSRWLGLALSAFAMVPSQAAPMLTVQTGSPPPPATAVVQHGDTWRYRYGTNEPQADWRTCINGALDASWLSGAGGFGYGDAGIQGEATTITGMRNVHSSFYIRREFTLAADADPSAEMQLVVDYDDGFVAYLDGVELVRRNLNGASNSPVAFNANAVVPHEASCCTAPMNPASTISLGAVGSRLAAGTHVLSFIALNDDLNSSDLHIIADLVIAPSNTSGTVNNGGYALTKTNQLHLSGTNTIPGSTRLTVNGDDANYNPANGQWNVLQPLQPGWNHLYIAALGASGEVLSNITQEVVHETSRIVLGGTLTSNVTVSGRGTVLHVNGNVVAPANTTLEIADGAVVLADAGRSIQAQAGGRIHVHGTFADKVHFHVNGPTTGLWGPLGATGTNSTLTVRFADVANGQVNTINEAVGLIEDSFLHDFDPGGGAGTLGRPIMLCNFATLFQARRVHVKNYYECLVRNGVIQIEECLFEDIVGDALDFDSALPGSFTRRCTYRNGVLGNVDAIDIGPADLPGSTDTLIADNIMLNFPFDKGVSVGDGGSSHGIIVSNCLISGCNAGVMAKDLCDVSVRNCTIVNNTSGFTNYNKGNPGSATGGGIITNSYNNILWNNITTIGMANNGQLYADHNDLGNTNWPGIGNINVDPLFVDAAGFNFRLQSGSPVRGAGRDGADMGITYPIGGIPMKPLWLQVVQASNAVPALSWADDSQNEDGVVVQRSQSGTAWQTIATLPAETTNYSDATAALGQKHYYRVQHTNYVGVSEFSNLASGIGATVVSTNELRLNIGRESTAVRVWFTAEANTAYRVEAKSELDGGSWNTVTNIEPAGTTREISLTNQAPNGARFFRGTRF